MNTENIRELIVNNMALANYLANLKKLSLPKNITFGELQSAAFMGLVEAANRFIPEKGICFSTYAYFRISGAMNDYLRELGKPMISLNEYGVTV